MNVSIVIMAAGLGTRMKSSISKVLHEISGYPMLYHILKEASSLSDDISLVLYHQADTIKSEMEKYFQDIHYVIQDHINFPGTGGAIMGVCPKHERVLVLSGDMPLVLKEDMELFLSESAPVVLSTFFAKDPTGYGRVIMDENKLVQKIVEQKDANPKELEVKSVNAGVYLFAKDFLENNLAKLTNNNNQNEYYITDLIGIAKSQNLDVKAVLLTKILLWV